MATVTGFSAARMLEIENGAIVDGWIDSNRHLVLQKRDGETIDAGDLTSFIQIGTLDTDSVDLTMTGLGSPDVPYVLKADVKNIPASATNSGVFDIARIPTMTAQALLDPLQCGPGPSRVTFLPGTTLSTEKYQWVGKFEPSGNRVVTMMRSGNSWVILGHSGLEGYGGKLDLLPLLTNNWRSYNRSIGGSNDVWAQPKAQRLHSGIVVLSGLIAYGASSPGSLIMTLPEMYRPDSPMIFPINNADTAKAIYIGSDGQVKVEGASWVPNSYISLDGIAFPAAGVATWTDVGSAGSGSSWANGWGPFNTAGFGNPAFWKDPYGFVWFKGLVGGGSTANNANIFTLPASHRAHATLHIKSTASATFGYLGAQTGDGINYKAGGNAWLTLASCVLTTPESVANNLWQEIGLANGWYADTSGYSKAAVLRRPDGLGMAKGLIRGGTAPAVTVATIYDYMLPATRIILYGISVDLFNRQDVYGMSDNIGERGLMRVTSGSTGWVSWDSHLWMVGD